MFNNDYVVFYYVYADDKEYIFEDFDKAEEFAEEKGSWVNDAWGDPIC